MKVFVSSVSWNSGKVPSFPTSKVNRPEALQYGVPLRTKLYRWQKHVENIIRKSKLVKYTECNKKYESRFAKYMCSGTKKKILSKCHDFKHESKF